MSKYVRLWPVFLAIWVLAGCRAGTPGSTVDVSPTSTPVATATSWVSPLAAQTSTPMATATPAVVEVVPTLTPAANEECVDVSDLYIGQPGRYVNVTYGYQLQNPVDWYTGFGNRPLLVSFSNLDPGLHNRASMRTDGCLIEIQASTNVFGLTVQEIRSQMPRAFVNAEAVELGGEPALHVREVSEQAPYESEWVLVTRENHWFRLSLDHAKGAADSCRPAWESLLSGWQWFEPDFAVYSNVTYGYAVSHPRAWYRFNPREEGISIASQDPTGSGDRAEFLRSAMVVDTHVFENAEGYPLKEWATAQEWKGVLTNDIPLEGLIGVRVLREGPNPEVQEVGGYYQGPLGRIYAVTCLYPADRQWEFRPIANAIIYSFSF